MLIRHILCLPPCLAHLKSTGHLSWAELWLRKKAQWNSSMMMVLHTMHTHRKIMMNPGRSFYSLVCSLVKQLLYQVGQRCKAVFFIDFVKLKTQLNQDHLCVLSSSSSIHSFSKKQTIFIMKSDLGQIPVGMVDQVKLFYPTIWMMMTCQLLQNNHAPWKIGISSLTLFSMPLIFVVATSGVTPPVSSSSLKTKPSKIRI